MVSLGKFMPLSEFLYVRGNPILDPGANPAFHYNLPLTSHCEKGMVAAINPPTSGNNTFANFLTKAKAVNATTASPTGGSTPTSGPSTTPTTSKKSAAVMDTLASRGSVAVAAVVGIVGALLSSAL